MANDMTNPAWRDANLDTLPEWHPTLGEFKGDLEALEASFEGFMRRYRHFLLGNSTDSLEDLEGHITDEVTLYLYARLDEIAERVWSVAA
jgi:hypothetical protein